MQSTSNFPPLKSTPLPMLLLSVTTSVAILAAGLLTLDEASPPSREEFTTTTANVTFACTRIDAMPRASSTIGNGGAICSISPRH